MAEQTKQWEIEQLDSSHDRGSFDCGVDPLSEFLKKSAKQNSKKNISRTYVAVRPGEKRVRGFYTVSTGTVQFDNCPEEVAKGLPKYPIPTVHLGRLAVDKSEMGKGLGRTLLMHALFIAASTSEKVGAYAVDVWAKDESAKTFYERYGFVRLLDADNHLILSVKAARKAFKLE